MVELTTKEAVKKVLRDNPLLSRYALAKSLSLQPIMITNYLRKHKPSRMSITTADIFKELYNITITDVYNPIKKVE